LWFNHFSLNTPLYFQLPGQSIQKIVEPKGWEEKGGRRANEPA
jgi:hypothetical protein